MIPNSNVWYLGLINSIMYFKLSELIFNKEKDLDSLYPILFLQYAMEINIANTNDLKLF